MDDLIVVRGTASQTGTADRGVLRITVRAKQPTLAEAERALAELTSAVDAVLDHASAMISARHTEQLSIRPNTFWAQESGRMVVDGHVGERSVQITLSDLEQAGSLIRTLYDSAAVEISGPEWELAPDNPVYGQIRRAAAQDARQRAEQYAEGLGLAVGGIAHVSEPGLRTEPPGAARAMAMRTEADSAEEPTIDLGSAEIRVSASVDVSFRIEPAR